MREKLVAYDERAGHWTRRLVNPHGIAVPVRHVEPRKRFWQREDVHLFSISFAAFFTAFYTFVS
jgi:hypothetical protein